MDQPDDLTEQLKELVDATNEAAQADRLAAGRLQELVESASALVGVADDWRTHSYGAEGNEQLREIRQTLDKIADAATTDGTKEDTLKEIAEALEKIAGAVPGQGRETDPDRKLVYQNAEKLAARIRYRPEPSERPMPTDPLPGPALRAQDPVGRLASDGAFESSATAKLRAKERVAIYGAGLDRVTKVRLDGARVRIDARTEDYLFFEVPEKINTGVVDLKFDVDGQAKPSWTTKLTVA